MKLKLCVVEAITPFTPGTIASAAVHRRREDATPSAREDWCVSSYPWMLTKNPFKSMWFIFFLDFNRCAKPPARHKAYGDFDHVA
jgi:hypothetical protein